MCAAHHIERRRVRGMRTQMVCMWRVRARGVHVHVRTHAFLYASLEMLRRSTRNGIGGRREEEGRGCPSDDGRSRPPAEGLGRGFRAQTPQLCEEDGTEAAPLKSSRRSSSAHENAPAKEAAQADIPQLPSNATWCTIHRTCRTSCISVCSEPR